MKTMLVRLLARLFIRCGTDPRTEAAAVTERVKAGQSKSPRAATMARSMAAPSMKASTIRTTTSRSPKSPASDAMTMKTTKTAAPTLSARTKASPQDGASVRSSIVCKTSADDAQTLARWYLVRLRHAATAMVRQRLPCDSLFLP